MPVTEEEIKNMIAAAVKGALEGAKEANFGGGEKFERTKLDERYFRRVKIFEGKEGTWKDWNFQFRVQVRAADNWCGGILDKIQVMGEADWDMFDFEETDIRIDKSEASCTAC